MKKATSRSSKLTKFQQEILDFLKRGGRLRSEICGWSYKNKTLSIQTEDAIRRTNLTTTVAVQGKRIRVEYVVHCDPENKNG